MTVPDLRWKARAACANVPTYVFFMDSRMSYAPPPPPHIVAPAKAICATCPVTAECLALGMSEDWGVFGGLTAQERRRIKRQRRAAS